VTTVEAHAKLTVHLHMTGLRGDGYHLIDAEMVSLDLCDRLTFSEGEGMEVTGPEAEGVPAGPGNLVARALALAGRTSHVRLDKRIPHGGGLGGGSSDAAAALRWAGALDPLRAAQIGADVPFCLLGGRARVTGVGEVLEPLSYVERQYTLLVPPFGVNTMAVYRAYDELEADGRARRNENNHLEAAALVVEPRLAEWRARLRAWTGAEPVLAGSGATWFVEGAHEAPPSEELGVARWFVTRTTRPLG